MHALIQKIKAWLTGTGRQEGFDYAMTELSRDPAAGPRLLLESQDMFGPHGWYPFNEGLCDAVAQFHRT